MYNCNSTKPVPIYHVVHIYMCTYIWGGTREREKATVRETLSRCLEKTCSPEGSTRHPGHDGYANEMDRRASLYIVAISQRQVRVDD